MHLRDLQKAFDSVHGGVISDTWRGLGICESFINLVYDRVSTLTFSILVEGQPITQFCSGTAVGASDKAISFLLFCSF